MRVDQYLYNVRQFKSRNIASHACKNGHVQINDKNVKPSREVVPTDLIKIRKIKYGKHLRFLIYQKIV